MSTPSPDSDLTYYLQRAYQEQARAAAATQPSAMVVHQQLADEYRRRADRLVPLRDEVIQILG